jgi:hypothetical protein
MCPTMFAIGPALQSLDVIMSAQRARDNIDQQDPIWAPWDVHHVSSVTSGAHDNASSEATLLSSRAQAHSSLPGEVPA